MSLDEEKVGPLGFQPCIAGILVENPSYVRKQTGRNISIHSSIHDEANQTLRNQALSGD